MIRHNRYRLDPRRELESETEREFAADYAWRYRKTSFIERDTSSDLIESDAEAVGKENAGSTESQTPLME